MHNFLKAEGRWDRILIGSSYLYLVIPIVIFLFGWLKLALAVLSVGLLLIGLYLTLKEFEYKGSYGFISVEFLVAAFLILVAWIVMSGIGGFGLQNEDFAGRNAVFRDLINHPWPVKYDFSTDAIMNVLFGHTGALVYYFAYWLPSALVGKLLGWKMANLGLFAWSLAGLMLWLLLLTRYMGKAKVLIVLAFVFWSGMDFIGTLVVNWPAYVSSATVNGSWSVSEFMGHAFALIFTARHLETWADAYRLNYNSNMVQLGWSFNSSIPAWLVTVLFLNLKGVKSSLFTVALLFFFSPLAGLVLIPYVLFRLVQSARDAGIRDIQSVLALFKTPAKYFSFQDTVVVVLLALVSGLFYGAQVGGQLHGFIWNLYPIDAQLILHYAVFVFLEFMAFGLLVFHGEANRPLLIFTLILLCILPLYQYSIANDLSLKGCVPPLMVLFAAGFKNITEKYAGQLSIRKQISRALLVIVLLLGSITAWHELVRSRDAIVAANGFPGYLEAFGTFANSEASSSNNWFEEKMHVIRNYVLGDPEDTVFFKYLARE